MTRTAPELAREFLPIQPENEYVGVWRYFEEQWYVSKWMHGRNTYKIHTAPTGTATKVLFEMDAGDR